MAFLSSDQGGRQLEIAMEPGDALVYSGPEVAHWRDAFAGQSQTQIFLLYVRRNGPNAHLRFDRRPRLGAPQGTQLQRGKGNEA